MELHQTVGFSVARQAAKGTAAAGPFVTGRMQRSGAEPAFDQDDPAGEHIGIHQRPTNYQSTPQRTGYLANVRAGWRLYPYLIGYGLLGVGYDVDTRSPYLLVNTGTGGTFTLTVDGQTTAALDYDATASEIQTALEALSNVAPGDVYVLSQSAGNFLITFYIAVAAFTEDDALLTGGTTTLSQPTVYMHTFTIPQDGDLPWLTVLSATGDSASRWERQVRDVRFTSLTVGATNDSLTASGEGAGLHETPSAMGQTRIAELDAALNPTTGVFEITSSDLTAASIGTPRGHEIRHTNPYDNREQELHSFYRADLAPQGLGLEGTLNGMQWLEDPFRELVYGAAAGTTPDILIPEAALKFHWESPAVIPSGGGLKHLLEYNITVAQIRMEPVEFTGQGRILYDLTYLMLDRGDAGTDPVTIRLLNNLSSYAGS